MYKVRAVVAEQGFFAFTDGEGETLEDARLDAVNQLCRNTGFVIYEQDCKFHETHFVERHTARV